MILLAALFVLAIPAVPRDTLASAGESQRPALAVVSASAGIDSYEYAMPVLTRLGPTHPSAPSIAPESVHTHEPDRLDLSASALASTETTAIDVSGPTPGVQTRDTPSTDNGTGIARETSDPAKSVPLAEPAAPPAANEQPAMALVATLPVPAPVVLSRREQGLLDSMNMRRAAAGLGPLRGNAVLTTAARSRSSDMIANNYFAHVGPHGESWYSALASVGWSLAGGGENLAKVSGGEDESVAVATEMLMASPTHRANILNAAFQLVGIGSTTNAAGLTVFTTIFTDR